jgi:NAD(P)H-hydrate epimerase
MQGYKPTVYYPKRPSKPLFENLVTQCEKMGIPFLYYFPSDTSLIRDSYNVIVDAIFGFSFKPPVRPEFAEVLSQMSRCGLPIVSIDVPSGEALA